MSDAVSVRAIAEADRSWLTEFMTERWGAPEMVADGRVFRPDRLPGAVAEGAGGVILGVVTWEITGDACQLMSIDAVHEGEGIGTALLEAACDAARAAGCRRIHLITTNDNLRALGFYQRRGFVLRELRPGAVDESRRLKPEIPPAAENGIPIRDEIVLERPLS
ncbi:MAG TPA: GNAT family N-acetyltransferase [Gaiellales bacterium]|nr:GNAT family N-acetyltransferase [Gaiellales bacterium]